MEKSQSVDLLEQGDLVMADLGFDIQDSMAAKHAKLFIPPKRQSGCFKTMTIAKVRIHVERAIRRLKGWHCIFDQVLPLSIVNQVCTVCCLLTNWQAPALTP